MNEQNYITLSSEKIEFHGFSKLSKRITFCFYDAGVVISPTEQTGRPNYFTANVNEDNCITDKNIIDILLREDRIILQQILMTTTVSRTEISLIFY